jgi:alginate production protein
VTGHRQRSVLSAPGTAGPRVRDDVDAWSADAGLRWQPSPDVPLQLGLAYSWSAGDAEEGGGQYRPTGLQSNYSRFTGTRSLVHRYNEAFRAEEGNLRVATAFASTSAGAWDASLVFNTFRRDDGGAPIFSDGLLVAPVNADEDIGRGYDLVISRYFAFGRERDLPGYVPGETGDSVVRLRGSLFEPGKAYGPDAGNEARVMLEFTLWY